MRLFAQTLVLAAALVLAATATASAAPANDAFANAQRVFLPDTVTGSTVDASLEAGEPQHITGGAHSVWYEFVSTASGRLSVDTCGSDFDTVIAVYDGPAVDELTPVASNDNGCGAASAVVFDVLPDTTYMIAVDGAAGASGQVRMLVTTAPVPQQPEPQPTCPPAGTPPGEHVYTGTHAQGGLVCLTVSPDFRAVTGWVALDVHEEVGGGCQWPVTQQRFGAGAAITPERRFVAPGVGGTFDGEQTASGTLRLSTFVPIGLFTCTSPLLTWSASTTSRFPFPPPPAAPDTTAPALTLSGTRSQRALRRGAIVVTVACPAESCIVGATGRLAVARRTIELRSASKALAAGTPAELALRLSARTRRRVAAALRAGRTVRVRLKVVAADRAGNATTAARTITIRR